MFLLLLLFFFHLNLFQLEERREEPAAKTGYFALVLVEEQGRRKFLVLPS